MIDSKARLEATKWIWTILGIALAVLFLSGGMADGLEATHVWMGGVLVIAGAISTGVIWNPEQSKNSHSGEVSEEEKVKRERIDAVLRDLSNDELIALKNRLSDGTINDDLLYEHMSLSDDGELIPTERRS